MAVFNRLSRLFKADFHAVLDLVEEPDVLLRQAIREMQVELAADEQRQRGLEVEQRQLQQRISSLQDALGQLEDELDTCFDAGKDDFARQLIRRKLEQQQRLRLIQQQREELNQQLIETQALLDRKHQLLETMQQQARSLLDNADSCGSDYEQFANPYIREQNAVLDIDVEVAFLKEQQRRAS